ncbi:MAG: DUF938 domain-containing protein [Myxococcota bacterium]
MRLTSPSAERNREPLASVLAEHLPRQGLLLEVASGSGEHAVHLAPRFPGLAWQPTDRDEQSLASIADWQRAMPADNLLPPLALDVTERPWPVAEADVVLAINLVHISPWAATEALMAGAAEVLRPGGLLVTYGAYKVGGAHTAASNEAFDVWLKERDPAFGVRDLEAVVAAAEAAGLTFGERIAMPANNFVLVFRRVRGSR